MKHVRVSTEAHAAILEVSRYWGALRGLTTSAEVVDSAVTGLLQDLLANERQLPDQVRARLERQLGDLEGR